MMVLNLILSFFLSFTSATPTDVKPMACNTKAFTDQVIHKLPKGYTFLKAYPVDGRQGQRKCLIYSYIFSKNSVYTIRMKNSSPKNIGLIVKVLDSRKRIKVSSYARGKYYAGLNYKCSATGIYYIKFCFDGKGDYCAGGVLAFKR